MAQVNSSSPARRFGVTCHSSTRAQIEKNTLESSMFVYASFPMPLDTLVESQRVKICRAVIADLRNFTSTAMLISCLLIPVPVSKTTLQNEYGAIQFFGRY